MQFVERICSEQPLRQNCTKYLYIQKKKQTKKQPKHIKQFLLSEINIKESTDLQMNHWLLAPNLEFYKSHNNSETFILPSKGRRVGGSD